MYVLEKSYSFKIMNSSRITGLSRTVSSKISSK
jgi:hypothetical protein